jgi:hypothetical protein
MQVEMTCALSQASRCYVYPYYFEATGSSGFVRGLVNPSQGALPISYIFGGTTVTGWVGFYVGKTETNILLIYRRLSQVFFAVQ